jgi:hypothetical protein
MAFSANLLRRSPWKSFSYAEDREQHMRWVLDGVRVAFAADAEVRSRVVSSTGASADQEARWESGRLDLARRLTPKLLARWRAAGELRALDAALEPLLPPQSLLLAAHVIALAAAGVSGSPAMRRLAVTATLAQVAYVIGGLATVDAPPSVWRALARVPWFVSRRLAVLARSAGGHGPSEWRRAARDTD